MSLHKKGDVTLVITRGGMGLVFVKNTKTYKVEVGAANLLDAFDDQEDIDERDDKWHGIQQPLDGQSDEDMDFPGLGPLKPSRPLSSIEEEPGSKSSAPCKRALPTAQTNTHHCTKQSKLNKKVAFASASHLGQQSSNELMQPSKKQKRR